MFSNGGLAMILSEAIRCIMQELVFGMLIIDTLFVLRTSCLRGMQRIKNFKTTQFFHSLLCTYPYDPPNLNLDPNVPNRSLSGGFVGL
jgi:hypothetical protein